MKQRLIAIGVGIAAALLVAAGIATYANAADLERGNIFADAPEAPKAKSWTGPYIGGSVGWADGHMDLGPMNLSVDGGLATGTVGYDRQFGYFVAGVGLEYSKTFGDIKNTLGISSDISGFGRAGILFNSQTLVYGHVGYGRISGGGDGVNSWRLGPGIELRLPGTPFTLDTRYTYHMVDDAAFGGADVSAHVIRSGINWRF